MGSRNRRRRLGNASQIMNADKGTGWRAVIAIQERRRGRWSNSQRFTLFNGNRGDATMVFAAALKRIGASPPDWTPFEDVTNAMDHPEWTDERERVYLNSRLQVHVVPHQSEELGEFFHVSFRNVDKTAHRDWRDTQRMKNELFGKDAEAVELYPKEGRLHDTCNQFHLWVIEANRTFPFGFGDRMVGETPFGDGGSQRKWDDDSRPDDLKEPEEVFESIGTRAPFVGTEIKQQEDE